MSRLSGEEWTEISVSDERIFVNLKTGECSWEAPQDGNVSIISGGEQWWELFDEKTSRYYYYNARTLETNWDPPPSSTPHNRTIVIPLHRLQVMNRRKHLQLQQAPQSQHPLRTAEKQVQTEEVLKVYVEAETQTESGRSGTSGGGGSVLNSLKDYLLREARFAGVSYDSSEDNWDADDEGDEEEEEDEDEEEEEEDDDEEVSEVSDDEVNDHRHHHHHHHRRRYELETEEDEEDVDGIDGEEEEDEVSHDIVDHRGVGEVLVKERKEERKATKEVVVEEKRPVPPKRDNSLKKDEDDLEKFAKENIKRHLKKGGVNLLLKRKESMKGMLIWTKNSIKQPMIATLLQNNLDSSSSSCSLKQEAIDCFKLIQEYSGDRPIASVPATSGSGTEEERSLLVAKNLLLKGVSKGFLLRDEIFVQLCRQTTENPSDESCRRALRLIALALFYFGPSSKFAPYLLSYLQKHKLKDDEVGIKVAINKLEKRMNVMKDSNSTSSFNLKKPSSTQELKLVLEAVGRGHTGWFGESLESFMVKQKEEEDAEDRGRLLPWIQVYLSETILKLAGAQTEGIFRIAPDLEEMSTVRLLIEILPKEDRKALFESHKTMDVNIFASLLKQWFRELKSPLIPVNLYSRALAVSEDPPEAVTLVMTQLPRLNQLILGYLIRFLQVFSAKQNVEKTKMDDNNLSMIWSPNILRAQAPANNEVLFENTRKEMLFIRTLIKHLNTSFIQGVL